VAKTPRANVLRPERRLGDIFKEPDAAQAHVRLSKALPSSRLAAVERLLVRIANRDFFTDSARWASFVPSPRDARRMGARLKKLRKGWPPDPRRSAALARLADKLERILFYFALPAFRDVLLVLKGAPAPDNFLWRLYMLNKALHRESKLRVRLQRTTPEVEMELEILRQIDLSDEPGTPGTTAPRGLRAAAFKLLGAAYAVAGIERELTPDSLRELDRGRAWLQSRFFPRPSKPRRR